MIKNIKPVRTTSKEEFRKTINQLLNNSKDIKKD